MNKKIEPFFKDEKEHVKLKRMKMIREKAEKFASNFKEGTSKKGMKILEAENWAKTKFSSNAKKFNAYRRSKFNTRDAFNIIIDY